MTDYRIKYLVTYSLQIFVPCPSRHGYKKIYVLFIILYILFYYIQSVNDIQPYMDWNHCEHEILLLISMYVDQKEKLISNVQNCYGNNNYGTHCFFIFTYILLIPNNTPKNK